MDALGKNLVVVLIAGFVLTACLSIPVYAGQQETEQKSGNLEKESSDKIKERQGSAVESQSPADESAGESMMTEENQDQNTRPAGEEEAEIIVPAPKDVKEATAIFVFLGWMWLAIFVLIYFLRLKVRETDRIHRLKFFEKDSG